MNQIYQKNLNAFSKRYPDAARFIDDLDIGDAYQVLPAQNAGSYIKVKRGDGYVFIGDQINPAEDVKKIVSNEYKKQCFFIVMGIGLGELLFESFNQYPESIFLCVEHDPRIFKLALKTNDFTRYLNDDRIGFMVGIKKNHLFKYCSEFVVQGDNSNYFPNLFLISNPQIVRYSQTYYQEVSSALKRSLDMFWLGVIGDDITDTLTGLENTLKNVKKVKDWCSIEPYQNYFKGKTGILVSSGPSLDNKLHLLKKHQDQAVIVCADSSLKLLRSNGIKPFAVASIERVENLAKLYQGFKIPDDILLFATTVLYPSIYEVFPGPIIPVFLNHFPFHFLPKFLPLRTAGMSCAHLNLLMLIFLGCEKIALVGQDLAYDRYTGETHFTGVVDYARAAETKRDKIKVPDHQGGEIDTNIWWSMFRDFFTMIVQHNPGSKVINVIEKDFGARIIDVDQVEPDVFFNQLAEEPVIKKHLDLKAGQSFMKDNGDAFLKELDGKKQAVLLELDILIEKLKTLADEQDFKTYYAKKKIILEDSHADAVYFYSYLLKPSYRRFDASAQSLWSSQEFRANLPEHLKIAEDVLLRLKVVLQKSL
ncbi:hypothetical protein BVY03_04770 [bacterium K02(2017)]|nr:hypothetical protein BVY03_04770 [bacterium K02(2017)]